ncbi:MULTISPECIES: hypothetical protein [unclassified Luteimonas]|uniref:hypothetical protein n=1 Tax=unclassified Luteimonas TaxID=2629088 RepID=UPI0016045E81|nr:MULTISPECIES: hypothetical protein [unclassified Luteimonas]MBB1473046.1 hypothetical protein [Luteimonas sp. MC1782]MBB6598253.1 hypothetical protein [Luteimonas sp. MC1825]QOC88469.1 hypothetical protein IDM46_01490 [Luteimonas sp. MC1825]
MHPVFVELFARPVGWLTIGGALIMFGITIGVPLFIRSRERAEAREAERKRLGTP